MLVQTVSLRYCLASIKAKCAVCYAEFFVDSAMDCDNERYPFNLATGYL